MEDSEVMEEEEWYEGRFGGGVRVEKQYNELKQSHALSTN